MQTGGKAIKLKGGHIKWECVTTSVLKPVITACAAWITNAIETEILTVMCYLGKVIATTVAIGLFLALLKREMNYLNMETSYYL